MVEFETVVKGKVDSQIKVGRMIRAELYPFIGKRVKVVVVELDESEF